MKTPKIKLLTEPNSYDLWLITFGDLLTLLLCFFLAIISLNSQKIKELVTKRTISSPGTLLAQPTSGEKRLWLTLSENEVESDNLNSLLKTKLAGLSKAEKIEIADVYIEVCDLSEEFNDEWKWHSSLERVLTLKRQVVDAYRLPNLKMVAERVLGPYCQGLSKKGADVIAAIGLKLRKV